MRYIFCLMLYIGALVAQAEILYPGQTSQVTFSPTGGEHSPSWSTNNPTLHLSSVGFLCNVTSQAYFSGSATVTCTYKDRIGTTDYTRTRRWTFTSIDTKISVYPTTKSLKVNESFQLSWSFDRAIYITPSIQFSGYDTNIISVASNGTVTAKGVGSTKVYVNSNLGTNSAICSVTVSTNSSGGSSIGETSPYDNWDSSNTKVITLKEPGTLSDYISDSQKYSISDLTLIGPLNGDDVRLLRDMMGVLDQSANPTNGKLTVLDLKNAIFVSGGRWYVQAWQVYEYTYDSSEMPAYAFAWEKKLKRIRFPKYCTKLTNGTLLQNEGMEQIYIHPGVTTIDYESFNGGWDNMPLSVLSLPSSLINFNAYIFYCKNLTDIYCYATTPPTIKYPSTFKSQTNISNGTLYIPKGCSKEYWQAEGWRDFKNIKEILDEYKTLYINVGANGTVKYKGENISQTYPVYYSGQQAFEVLTSEPIEIEIIPDEGYSVSEIKFGGQLIDIIPSDNKVSLGKIDDHTTVEVSFAKFSSINEITTFSDNKLRVHNLYGIYIGTFEKIEDIRMLPKGIYIINSEKGTEKLLIW